MGVVAADACGQADTRRVTGNIILRLRRIHGKCKQHERSEKVKEHEGEQQYEHKSKTESSARVRRKMSKTLQGKVIERGLRENVVPVSRTG